MAFPGYLGQVWFQPMTVALPPPLVLSVPPGFPMVPLVITPSNIPRPVTTPQPARVKEFEPNEQRRIEETTPTGNFGYHLGTRTGQKMQFRTVWDMPVDGDPYELDPPDLEQVDYVFVDARIEAVQGSGAFSGTPRGRRFIGYVKIENLKVTCPAQAVVQYSFDGTSHGLYYWGRNVGPS